VNGKSLGALRQKLRKYIRENLEEEVAKFRENPDAEDDEEEEQEDKEISDDEEAEVSKKCSQISYPGLWYDIQLVCGSRSAPSPSLILWSQVSRLVGYKYRLKLPIVKKQETFSFLSLVHARISRGTLPYQTVNLGLKITQDKCKEK
jgi:hypothetical protein